MDFTIYGLFKNKNLVYIGQTRQSVEKRIYQHFNSALLVYDNGMPITRTIKKYEDPHLLGKIKNLSILKKIILVMQG